MRFAIFFMQPAPAPLAPPRPRRGICFLETSHVKQPMSFRASRRAWESINKLRSGKKLWIAMHTAFARNDIGLVDFGFPD